MRDPFQWSIRLGQLGGVAVRLHVFFLVFAAATFYFAIPDVLSVTAWWMAGGKLLGITAATVAILFASVVLHELGHYLAARRVGIRPTAITIGPLGGLPPWRLRVAAHKELAILAVGPLVNLVLALLCLAVILVWPAADIDLPSLWNPFQPAGTLALTLQLLAIGLWINWLLFVLNVLPAHPFDGRRMLHAALRWARPQWDERRVAEWVCRVAVVLAIAVGLVAVVLAKYYAAPSQSDTPFPVWAALVLLAILLLVSARRELDDIAICAWEEELGVRGTEPPAVESGPVVAAEVPLCAPSAPDADWDADLENRPDPVHREEIEAEEERQVDAILTRLHAHGMDSLTADERALLNRVSARYRIRLGRRT
ncbi:MAG: hypothetical protein GXY58_15450 [Planctomycetaceae bacterium]|nr:hypothetical protein [Planctomycetaceae bacterium]